MNCVFFALALLVSPVDDFTTRPFQGSFREGCKTVMVQGDAEVFGSVAELKKRFLIADKTMLKKHPEVKDTDQARIDEENHVVTVTGFLLSCKSEKAHFVKRNGVKKLVGDNDFHLIIGDSATDQNTMLNVEVSGLPRSGDPDGKFAAVRQELLNVFVGAGIKPAMSYRTPSQPVKVTITGSLYFDSTHGPGDAGDRKHGFVPKTVWEIHPIHQIGIAPVP